MATVVATPVVAYAAAVLSGTGVAASTNLTVTINVTAGWEVQVPVRAVQAANVSAGPEIYAFRSYDGGTNYENVASTGFSVLRTSSGDSTKTLYLPTGQWAIQLLSGGPNTATFAVNTLFVITAVQLV